MKHLKKCLGLVSRSIIKSGMKMKMMLASCKVLLDLLSDYVFLKGFGRFPVKYFSGVQNAGDDLNDLVIQGLSKKKVYNVKTASFKHVLPIGSIMYYSTPNSIIYGSGFISEESVGGWIPENVVALRGEFSKKVYQDSTGKIFSGVLGDPAILAPKIYSPKIEKKTKVGIVLHYAHGQYLQQGLIPDVRGVRCINVQLPGKEFIDQILSCDFIVSSSLHGLILADVYGIKNCWITFDKMLPGGYFKFKDYYSTTESEGEMPLEVKCTADMLEIVNNISKLSSIKKYKYDPKDLVIAFEQCELYLGG